MLLFDYAIYNLLLLPIDVRLFLLLSQVSAVEKIINCTNIPVVEAKGFARALFPRVKYPGFENIDKRYLERNLDHSRKQRTDAGVSILDATAEGDKKRAGTFTALDYFKRHRRANARADSHLTDSELKREFDLLTKKSARALADRGDQTNK